MREIREESIIHFCKNCGKEFWVEMMITEPGTPGPRRVYFPDELGYCLRCHSLAAISRTYE